MDFLSKGGLKAAGGDVKAKVKLGKGKLQLSFGVQKLE